jgi:hypothetical protein
MRPGSLERIEYYKQRAEIGLPLFEDAPAGIPMLPGQRNVCEQKSKPKPTEPKKMNIDEAIEVLTADGAEERLNSRIEALEEDLAKLKKLRRVYAISEPKPGMKIKDVDPKLEDLILKAVAKGPKMPKEISEEIGIPYMNIGKIVNASQKLKKVGNAVAAVS